jgi:hypothetical protein
MRFSSQQRKDLRYLHDHEELVSSSPERKECPAKGSSARVAREERIVTIGRITITHRRPSKAKLKARMEHTSRDYERGLGVVVVLSLINW